MKKLVTLWSSLLIAAGFPSCSTIGTSSLSNQSSTYQAPKNYAQHIAQQRGAIIDSTGYSYTDHGVKDAKQTIVMLHGVPTSSWMYRKIIPALQQKYRVVTVDLLGFGSSSKAKYKPEDYQPQNQARKIRSLLKTIKVKNYTLMMHDMGGLIAWEMLRQDSGSIRNLVVLNTIVTEKGFNHPKMEPGALTKLVTNSYTMPGTSSLILSMTFRHMGLTGAEKLKPSECKGYIAPLKDGKGSGDALYAFYTSLNPTLYARLASHQSTLRNFKGKTLVLWGAEDENLTVKQIPYLKKQLRIPAKNIHIYPAGGHLLTEEMPQEVILQVSQFLK